MILLRHCQSEFNLHFTRTRRDPGIVDPVLTPLGMRQAEAAAEALSAPGADPITRILCSPYRRAIQTATPLAERLGLTVAVTTEVRERFAFVCDVGSAGSVLRRWRPDLDLSAVPERWWPEDEEQEDAVSARASAFRDAAMARSDWRTTLVVSHWGFLLALTGRSVGNGEWLRLDPNAPAS
ncbi:histidine phosphatase family protein [Rhizosaccharibacter radicis]|uniref:Phosphoglycerate mutase family protein n=1 Tax=Rhizosaccharibacter radicis TaxID=2782605 RepID=A0ABT1VW57_9PROT|nr:phosphoglycerate mutase family protein [Acetobacteraceae bacterium KSS12]